MFDMSRYDIMCLCIEDNIEYKSNGKISPMIQKILYDYNKKNHHIGSKLFVFGCNKHKYDGFTLVPFDYDVIIAMTTVYLLSYAKYCLNPLKYTFGSKYTPAQFSEFNKKCIKQYDIIHSHLRYMLPSSLSSSEQIYDFYKKTKIDNVLNDRNKYKIIYDQVLLIIISLMKHQKDSVKFILEELQEHVLLDDIVEINNWLSYIKNSATEVIMYESYKFISEYANKYNTLITGKSGLRIVKYLKRNLKFNVKLYHIRNLSDFDKLNDDKEGDKLYTIHNPEPAILNNSNS